MQVAQGLGGQVGCECMYEGKCVCVCVICVYWGGCLGLGNIMKPHLSECADTCVNVFAYMGVCPPMCLYILTQRVKLEPVTGLHN